MEKRRFRLQIRPLPRRGRTSWPGNEGGDFWQQEKLQSRFLSMLRLKVSSRKLQASSVPSESVAVRKMDVVTCSFAWKNNSFLFCFSSLSRVKGSEISYQFFTLGAKFTCRLCLLLVLSLLIKTKKGVLKKGKP